MKPLVASLAALLLASCSEPSGAAASGKLVLLKGDRELKDADYKIPGKVSVLDFSADW
jgi:hypothetical protein